MALIFAGVVVSGLSAGIGKTSPVFSTADTDHSDTEAPTGLLGLFRGRRGSNLRSLQEREDHNRSLQSSLRSPQDISLDFIWLFPL